MKSLKDIVTYYEGTSRGVPTSALDIEQGTHRLGLGDNRKDIDAALLYDANRLTRAALASYLASSWGRMGGHNTWGEIILYYSQFQVITALLRLAGIGRVYRMGSRTQVPPGTPALLLRTNENRHSYAIVPESDEVAKRIGYGRGGSHKANWLMFSRRFREWEDSEPRDYACNLEEDSEAREAHMAEPYELLTWFRNQVNYPQVVDGLFFPEADISRWHSEDTIRSARTTGHWDWLRRDSNPFSPDDPPEAHFAWEMMTWDLIKYTIRALVTLEGQLMSDYVWIIRNLDAFEELKNHMLAELQGIQIQ